MNTQTKAQRLADLLTTDAYWSPMLGEQAAAELRRLDMVEFAFDQWHEKTEWVQDTAQPGELGMHRADVLKQRIDRLHEVNHELVKAYRKMYNSAAGYSNYCEDSANTRRCERDFEEADAIFRAAIAKATGEQA